MFNQIINILKKLIVPGIITGGLIALGLVIDNFVPWIWLTWFFVIIRHLMNLFGWLYDLPTVWTLIGWSWLVLGAYWIYIGTLTLIKIIEKPQ